MRQKLSIIYKYRVDFCHLWRVAILYLKRLIDDMNSYFNENTLEELIDEIKYVYKSDNRPWIIGYSGGKDSTTVVELVYRMLLSLPIKERKKNVYIISSDTMIENPLIKVYLSRMNKMLGEAAKKDNDQI